MTTHVTIVPHVYVRALVRTPDGDKYVVYGGATPTELWDDPKSQAAWKRWRRGDILAKSTGQRNPLGYQVTWHATTDGVPFDDSDILGDSK